MAMTATMFATVVSLNFSACTAYDEPMASSISQNSLSGLWISEQAAQGTIGEGEDAQQYVKVVRIADFQNDTEGIWFKYFINAAGDVITDGGATMSDFCYSAGNNGRVDIYIVHNTRGKAEAKNFTMNMTAEKMTADDFELTPATDAQKQQIQAWGRQMGLGFSIEEDDYNINSDSKMGVPFDRMSWRNQNAIYLYVGNTSEMKAEIKDSKDRAGYTAVMLPWATTSNGRETNRMSNLPAHFCDDITPENGWDLVANFCGNYNIPNANYFVLYNKYLGKMRYFYYMPKDAQFNNAKDHNWEILMENGTAEHSVFRYAVPMNKKIKNGKAINADNSGYWSQIVTPWTSTVDKLGQQAPSQGWFAFDVDLSVYRGAGNTMAQDGIMKPFLRGYSKSNVNLYGKLKADIEGKIEMKQCCVNTSNGVFGPLEDMLGQVKGIKDFIGGAKQVYQNLMSGDILGAIEGGINVAKQGCDIVGIDYGKTTEGFNGYKGEVNLKMNGTLDVEGMITSTEIIQAVATPELGIQHFDFENSTLGQGVWNLETSPVVYHTNAFVNWTLEGGNYLQRQSPFNGYQNWTEDTKAPHRGHVCYFDPSSIKVVLNPNVFTEEEIQSAKVYAICGVRKDAKFGSTEMYRTAMDLQKSQYKPCGNFEYYNRPFTEAPFDAYSSNKNDMGMKAVTKLEVETVDGFEYGLFGRGDADFLVEPQTLKGNGAPDLMPAYEVNVTVMVMHNGSPIVYSRTYLPEYKEMRIENMPEITDSYIKQSMPEHYVAEVYAQQMAHVKDVRNWTRRTLIATAGTPSHQHVLSEGGSGRVYELNKAADSPKESFAALFDNDLSNRWVSSYNNVDFKEIGLFSDTHHVTQRSVASGVWKNYPCWYVEFKSNQPISPRSYSLISANDAGKYPQCNPQCWILFGKKNAKDSWTMLGMSSYNNQPEDMLPRANSKATKELPFRFNKCEDMQYFRLEIMKTDKSDQLMRLGEIRFNYDD